MHKEKTCTIIVQNLESGTNNSFPQNPEDRGSNSHFPQEQYQVPGTSPRRQKNEWQIINLLPHYKIAELIDSILTTL